MASRRLSLATASRRANQIDHRGRKRNAARAGLAYSQAILAAADIAGHTARRAADDRAGPRVAARDCRDAGAGTRADCRAAHRALRLRAHIRTADDDRQRADAYEPSKSFHDRRPYWFF